MPAEPRIRVLVVARDLEIRRRIAHALGAESGPAFDLEEVPDAAAARDRLSEGAIDVAIVRLQPPDGLAAVRNVSSAAPDVPVVALLATGGPDASETAVRAGAVDAIAEDRLDAETLRRSLRFASERSRLQGEVHRQTVIDRATDVYNARGFEQLVEHHLRLAERTGEPVVLVFVRVEERSRSRDATAALVRDTVAVLREAVREADVVGRLGVETFGVLLSGDASGKEGVVLSRIVDAVATRNARAGVTEPLALSIGSATYGHEHRVPLRELIREADERMRSSTSG